MVTRGEAILLGCQAGTPVQESSH